MLHFSDAPYRFFPPRYFGPTAWLIRRFNRRWLRSKLKIESVDIHGRQHLDAIPRGTHIVLLPNHPTHCDASILLEVCRQIGVRPRIMAAYDLYHRGLLEPWVLKRVGCFSVDREGSDKPAMEEAAKTILDGQFALTMFPEGNVYLENDRVAPFHDGAAFLSVRAAKQLAEKGERVVCVPISTKATHLTDCRPALRSLLRTLCEKSAIPYTTTATPLEILRHIGLTQMRQHLQSRGIALPADGELKSLVSAAAEDVLDRLEPQLKLTPRAGSTVLERIRAARRIIHEVRTDADRAADHAEAARWADDAMLAFRIASYSGDYVAQRPSLDRIGETVEKLFEDTHDCIMPPYAPRQAIVRINPPIDVTALLDGGAKQKQVIQDLTAAIEDRVQAGVDQSNAENRAAGTMLWNEAAG